MKSKTAITTIEITDAEIGKQLTAQYHRAVSGMREVLIFGAMLMQVENNVSARGHIPLRGGRDMKGGGLKAWLAKHTPEINRSTAYRFLGVTKAIAAEYNTIVGTRTAKKYTLHDLVLAEPAQLPAPIAAKQLELFDYVAGTSQRSWLDQFREYTRTIGGDTRKIDPATGQRVNHARKSLDERLEIARGNAHDAAISILRACSTLYDNPDLGYHLLPPAEQNVLADAIAQYAKTQKRLLTTNTK